MAGTARWAGGRYPRLQIAPGLTRLVFGQPAHLTTAVLEGQTDEDTGVSRQFYFHPGGDKGRPPHEGRGQNMTGEGHVSVQVLHPQAPMGRHRLREGRGGRRFSRPSNFTPHPS